MDSKQYLTRIRYQGETKPTLAVLSALQKHHLLNVPFENLDIHFNRPIILNGDHFFDKVVVQKRGGFCYELNGLFHALLIELGFDATIISARVHTRKNNYSPEYDHLAIVVAIDNKQYLADVGFGEFSFIPLEIVNGKEQHDQRGTFIIENYHEGYCKVSKIKNAQPVSEYIFTTTRRGLSEFEAMCHYHQTNPDSHFKQKRLITRPTEDGRITLSGNNIKIVENGTVSRGRFAESSFKNKLLKYFDIEL